MWNDVKYLFAYTTPAAAAWGIWYGGIWSPAAFYLGFILIPLVELVLPVRTDNPAAELEPAKSAKRFYDFLLYVHIPIIYSLIVLYIWRVGYTPLPWLEVVGMTASLGIILGSYGINVAHELGHRPGVMNAWAAQLLLVPSFYTHFTIEHNFGHHRHVATPEDPATARIGESVYRFWLRSTVGSLVNAWRLEHKRLSESGRSFYGLSNHLLIGLILEFAYLGLVLVFGGWFVLLMIIVAGIVGFLLLETVNYIEHYGLLRRKLPSGQHEPVDAAHSWNSNHELGRIYLYELTRHADHHYRTSRKYQILRHLEGAPQLPTGYPGSMILALVPALWRRIIDPRISGGS